MAAGILLPLLIAAFAAAALFDRRGGSRAAGAVLLIAAIAFLCIVGYFRIERSRSEQQARDAVTTRALAEQRAAEVQRMSEAPKRRLQAAHELAATQADADAANGTADAAPARASEPSDVTPPAGQPLAEKPADAGAASVPEPPSWLTLSRGKQPDGSYRAVVMTQDRNVNQCWNSLRRYYIPQEVSAYARSEIGGRWRVPALDPTSTDSLIADSYVDTQYVQFDRNGPYGMYKVYVLLDIPPTMRETLVARRGEEITESRLLYASLAAAVAVGLLVVVFGYLKIDDATEGQYSRRLQIAAAVLLAGIIGAGIAVTAFAATEESYFGGFLSTL